MSKNALLRGPKVLWLIVITTVLLAGMAVGQLASAGPNPPGNNGTVKIDDVAFDDHPNNEPHVGCVFQVDFYGYDQGDLNATVTFQAHPPTQRTGDDQVLLTDTVFIGEDDNSGGGSQAGLDASETYTLDFTGITPHPVQGFHVKLTVNAEGSQGADVKHKVFWVTGCAPAPTTTTTAPTTTVVPDHDHRPDHDHVWRHHDLGCDLHLGRHEHVRGDLDLRCHHQHPQADHHLGRDDDLGCHLDLGGDLDLRCHHQHPQADHHLGRDDDLGCHLDLGGDFDVGGHEYQRGDLDLGGYVDLGRDKHQQGDHHNGCRGRILLLGTQQHVGRRLVLVLRRRGAAVHGRCQPADADRGHRLGRPRRGELVRRLPPASAGIAGTGSAFPMRQ